MKLVVFVAAFFLKKEGFTCDVCGCAINNFQIPSIEGNKQHYFSARYTMSKFLAHVNSSVLKSEDYFSSIELIGHLRVNPKLRVVGAMPYNTYRHEPVDINTPSSTTSGLGDINFIGLYNIWNKKKYEVIGKTKDAGPKISLKDLMNAVPIYEQSIWVGGGIKLPSGKYVLPENVLFFNVNNIGTGSLDFMLQGIYEFVYKRFAVICDVNYKMNTTNSYGYKFGNRLNTLLRCDYMITKVKNFGYSINALMGYDIGSKNQYNGKSVDQSGLSMLKGGVGLDVQYRQYFFGSFFNIPFYQNNSNGLVRQENLLSMQFVVLF